MSPSHHHRSGNAVLILVLVGAVIIMLAAGVMLSRKNNIQTQLPTNNTGSQTQPTGIAVSGTPTNTNSNTPGTTDQKINDLDNQDATVNQSLSVTPPDIMGE